METGNIYAIVGIGALLVAFFVAWDWYRISRSRAILREWAAWNGLEVLAFKRTFLFGGFSPFTTSKRQVIFWVRVRDGGGLERSGWVRCGSYWGGVVRSQAEVKWETNVA